MQSLIVIQSASQIGTLLDKKKMFNTNGGVTNE